MKGIKVHFFVSDEDIAIYIIKGKYSPSEYSIVLEHGFLTDAINLAHIETFLVILVNDELVNAVLHLVVIFLFATLIQEDSPLLQILQILVGWVHGYVKYFLLICSVRSS